MVALLNQKINSVGNFLTLKLTNYHSFKIDTFGTTAEACQAGMPVSRYACLPVGPFAGGLVRGP
jgi:hypothetical protein